MLGFNYLINQWISRLLWIGCSLVHIRVTPTMLYPVVICTIGSSSTRPHFLCGCLYNTNVLLMWKETHFWNSLHYHFQNRKSLHYYDHERRYTMLHIITRNVLLVRKCESFTAHNYILRHTLRFTHFRKCLGREQKRC